MRQARLIPSGVVAGTLLMCALCASATKAAGAQSGTTLYVAPDGKPTWSGRIAEPSEDGTDGPLPSPAAARDAIRARRAKGEWKSEPITVVIHGGTYFLAKPLKFAPEDGGSADAPVTYTAQQGQAPLISGGVRVTGFKPVEVGGKKLWATELPDVKAGKWYFRQLFVDGNRRPRPRLPKEGYYTFAGLPTTRPETQWTDGQQEAAFKPGELKAGWKNLSDVDVIALSLWIESHLPVTSVDDAAHTVKFGKKSVFRLTASHNPKDFSRYYVENVFEALDEPGEWYLDRPTGTLYYMPMPEETPDKLVVIAPRLEQLLLVKGPVSSLHFNGLQFAHAEWTPPTDVAGYSQAAIGAPGAVFMDGASNCLLRDCSVSQVSSYAVEFATSGEGNRVENCQLTDLGAGGVKIGHHTSKTTVENCDIGPGGAIHHAAVGVWIGNSGDNTVTHNDIHDLYYTGVSVGWTWGYGESKAVRNRIEFNHIYNIGKGMLSDMGGIYTLGVSPGTVLRSNRIHDIAGSNYGGWGIYNDEGSTGILIEDNVVYRTTHGGYHQHYGKENIIRNNIFAFAMSAQIIRSRDEEHLSFTFERNIVLWLAGPLLGSTWANGNYKLDSNCYWRIDAKPIEFAGMTLEQWRAKGQDVHSIIADPGFADAQGGNFTLPPDSPALKVGFKPIDTSGIGRQKKPPAAPRASN